MTNLHLNIYIYDDTMYFENSTLRVLYTFTLTKQFPVLFIIFEWLGFCFFSLCAGVGFVYRNGKRARLWDTSVRKKIHYSQIITFVKLFFVWYSVFKCIQFLPPCVEFQPKWKQKSYRQWHKNNHFFKHDTPLSFLPEKLSLCITIINFPLNKISTTF